MADLTDFYPKAQTPSPNGRGAPASPAASGMGIKTTAIASPALWTLAFVGVALLLLHNS